MMSGLIAAFLSSFFITFLVIRFKHLHGRFSIDWDTSGPQKVHTSETPRIGGISIEVGLVAAIAAKALSGNLTNIESSFLICAFPTFSIGLIEDLTKKISIKLRLFFTAISAICLILLFDIQITNLDIPFFDLLFSIPLFGIGLTVFAITGLANSYNIIDGFNGLSSMVGIITLLALAYVGYLLGDLTVVYLSLIMASAILGFFIWNYPRGLIFLGDGGAYLIGFWIGSLSVWLCCKHSEVSPWFALLINGYPIMETIFTIYRRRIHQKKSPGQPDGIHFHTLIYRRILQTKHFDSVISANARTAPYLWILAVLSITPALLWWQSTAILSLSAVIFAFGYVWLYKKIVKFKTPRWMNF